MPNMLAMCNAFPRKANLGLGSLQNGFFEKNLTSFGAETPKKCVF